MHVVKAVKQDAQADVTLQASAHLRPRSALLEALRDEKSKQELSYGIPNKALSDLYVADALNDFLSSQRSPQQEVGDTPAAGQGCCFYPGPTGPREASPSDPGSSAGRPIAPHP